MKIGYVEGVNVYDPRDNTYKVSDNPALVISESIERGLNKHSGYQNDYWLDVCYFANYCDSKNNGE